MKLEAYGKSEKGLHLRNQDAFLIDLKRGLFAVADGVTISRGRSEKASREAVKTLKRDFKDMESAFLLVNKSVSSLRGAGETTLTVAHVHNNGLAVGHVGDSSLFLVRGRPRSRGL